MGHGRSTSRKMSSSDGRARGWELSKRGSLTYSCSQPSSANLVPSPVLLQHNNKGPFQIYSSLAPHRTFHHPYRITPTSVRLDCSRRAIPYRTIPVRRTGLQTSRSRTMSPTSSATLTYAHGPKVGTPSPTAKSSSYRQSTPMFLAGLDADAITHFPK